MAPELPTGVLTFLMTDVESSTALWQSGPGAASLLARQAELIADAVGRHGGVQPADQGEGDSVLAAFVSPAAALAAAIDAQRALAEEPWPEGRTVRVRMALHSGEVELRDARNYGGLALIRCARLRSLAHGGQVLVSNATAVLAGEQLQEGASLLELETVPLADFERPERVHQLCHAELPHSATRLRRSVATALPTWPTPLVGRAEERRAVLERIAECRLVTLTGAGGSGKTRLAHAVAEDLQARFRDGVAWVDLARLAVPEQVLGAAIAAAGAHESAGVPALESLVRHLAQSELLLVLDNCEHLIGACAELAEALLRACPGVVLLVTSREPLGVAGEAGWRVPSLPLPDPDDPDAARIAASDAVALFVERARAVRADFQLDGESAPLVARICCRLDGIPLALELAAARVRAISLQRLADGLDDRFRLLTGGARTAVARQRTLLASVEWSHDLLDEEERALFRRLAVFAAPFTIEAAEAVAADEDLDTLSVFDLLARLVDKSLVLHAGDRYRMLETIRQYALERADDAGELGQLRDRELAWFERRARGWRLDCELVTGTVLADLAVEAPDLLAAAEWSAGRGQAPVAILHALADHWGDRDAFSEAGTVARRILGALPAGSQAWLEAAAAVAMILMPAGEHALLGEARAALDAGGSGLDAAAAATIAAASALPGAFLGRSEGLAMLRSSAELGRQVGNRKLELHTTSLAAMILAQNGDVAGARALLPWLGRNVSTDARSYYFYEAAQIILATYDGDLALARGLAERALAGNPRLAVLAVVAQVGWLSMDSGLMRRVVAEAQRFALGGVYANLESWAEGMLLCVEGDLVGAARRLDEASRHTLITNRWTLLLRAGVALSLGDAAAAEALLRQLGPALEGSAQHLARAVHDLLTAQLARGRGDRAVAEERAHAALASACARGISLSKADALELLALLAGDRGELAEAARLAGAAEAFRERAGYRWRTPSLSAALEELRPKLPEPAMAEGAALSLDEAAAYASRGRGERGRPDRGWESLTPSELRVVELVADGLPNAAIAKRLFVSLATVKTHLVHVYGKLELATRAELVAAATRRRLQEGPS